jgi:hypothetical protein
MPSVRLLKKENTERSSDSGENVPGHALLNKGAALKIHGEHVEAAVRDLGKPHRVQK